MYLGKVNQLHTALAVPSQSTVWSYSFNCGFAVSFSLTYQCASNGTIAIKIQLEQGYKLLTGVNNIPVVSGQQELLTSAYYTVPDLQSDVVTLTSNDQNQHTIGFAPTEARFARFKLIGQAGNDASTTISLVVSVQEPSRVPGAA